MPDAQAMTRRTRAAARVACLVFLLVAMPALGADEAAVDRCFELRDGDPAAAVAEADAALATSAAGPEVEIKLRTCLARSLALTGDAARAQAEVAHIDTLLAQHPMPPEFQLRALSNAGATLHTLGWTRQALDYYRRAHEAATAGDADEAQASILINVASIHSESLGDYQAAEALYEQAEAASARAGGATTLLSYNRAQNSLRMGRLRDALAQFEAAEQSAAAEGHSVVEQRARAERIALEARDETLAQAMEALAAIAREQQRLEDPSGASTTLVRLSSLALRNDDPQAALDHAIRAAALVDGPAFDSGQREALEARIAAHAAQDDWRGAYEATEVLRAMEVEALRRHTLDSLAGLQAQLQDTEREREFLRLQDTQRREALDSQHSRRWRNLWIAGLVLVLLLGVAFGWYQRRVNRRLAVLSQQDPLTGLLNRRAATARLQRDGGAAEDGLREVVFLIDVDHFKARNDSYGHSAGDAALAGVARELRRCCRPEDIVARWGGEEFLVGCGQLSLAQAQEVAERLRTAAADTAVTAGNGPAEGRGTPTRLSVSIGFACYPFFPGARPAGDWQDAVALADRALYAAKHSGRDAWVGLWGHEDAEAPLEDVINDPEAHIASGAITVVSSREPVRWHREAGQG